MVGMKPTVLTPGAVATLAAFAAVLSVGVSTPRPAGACSCLYSSSDLTLTEVRLVNPPDIESADIEEMISDELAQWPQEALFEHQGYFSGTANETSVFVELEVE